MGIEAIGTGIKTTILATITSGLRVYAANELPDTIETPGLIILLGAGKYATAFDSGYHQVFRLILCLAKQDSPEAFNRLLDYVEPTGSKSIFAALDADKTLDGSCDTSKCTGFSGAGSTAWGSINYLSTEFELLVWS